MSDDECATCLSQTLIACPTQKMPQFSLRKNEKLSIQPNNTNSLSSTSSAVLSTSPNNQNNSPMKRESVSEARLSPDNIEKIEKIGEGAFGEVWYVFNCLLFLL